MSPAPAPSPAAPDRPVGVLGLGAYVPDRIMANEEWARHVDTTDAWITERTGIKRRRIASEEQSTVDLAQAAATAALDDAGLDIGDIDELIVATDTPELFLPDTASVLQHRLGAGAIPSYDLGGSGCAGFVLALDIARSRAADRDRRVLVVGVELLTRLMDWTDRNTCVLFGDAAGAAVVGRSERGSRILAARAGTDGSRGDILCLEVGGTRLPFSEERARQGLHKRVVMKGREVFREAVARMTAVSRAVLDDAGLSLDQIALVVPHQANLRILRAVQQDLGLPDDRVFVNVQEYGNTGSASVPLALWDARRQGRVKPGDLVLLTAFGAGFHWAGLVLRL